MNLSGGSTQLARGHALQQQGRLAEAAAAFRELLNEQPHNAQALHLLGITVGQMGRPQEALALIARAIEVEPSNPVMHTNLAKALAESGRHAEALKSFDRALALQPDLAAAHRGRGLALVRLGEKQAALASLGYAAQLAPYDAQVHNDLGVALELAGRKEEALKQFERAVALDPQHLQAHHNRGAIETSLGRHSEALASLERALALQPRNAALLANRGSVLRALGRPMDALASYDRALASTPGNPAVHYNRGVVLLSLKRHEDALGSFDRALALAADNFAAHFHRGVALALLERHAESLASFDRALSLNAQSAEALNNRGTQLEHLGRSAEALEAFSWAIASKPDYAAAHINLANILKGLGRFQEARESFDRALALEGDHATALWGKSLLELTLGEFEAGWPLYESRLRLEDLRPYHRSFAVPRWSGAEPLTGRTLLIHAEQGLGDTLQFARYIPLLEARGAHVVFEVPGELGKLMRSLPMRGTLLTRGEPLPEFDYYCPLLSLPLAFRTQRESIPGGVPYVAADRAAVDAWRERLCSLPGLKIGLNWQGHVGAEKQPWVRGRSFALACAAPLARVPGVSLVSLQKGEAARQRSQVEFGGALAELSDPLDTSADALVETAALMGALDLVITSDTSVAHLAGALGVPVWVVLQRVPDWRWLLEGSGCAWYPTMRLFRQRVAGDWSEVFARVADDLAAVARAGKIPAPTTDVPMLAAADNARVRQRIPTRACRGKSAESAIAPAAILRPPLQRIAVRWSSTTRWCRADRHCGQTIARSGRPRSAPKSTAGAPRGRRQRSRGKCAPDAGVLRARLRAGVPRVLPKRAGRTHRELRAGAPPRLPRRPRAVAQSRAMAGTAQVGAVPSRDAGCARPWRPGCAITTPRSHRSASSPS